MRHKPHFWRLALGKHQSWPNTSWHCKTVSLGVPHPVQSLTTWKFPSDVMTSSCDLWIAEPLGCLREEACIEGGSSWNESPADCNVRGRKVAFADVHLLWPWQAPLALLSGCNSRNDISTHSAPLFGLPGPSAFHTSTHPTVLSISAYQTTGFKYYCTQRCVRMGVFLYYMGVIELVGFRFCIWCFYWI